MSNIWMVIVVLYCINWKKYINKILQFTFIALYPGEQEVDFFFSHLNTVSLISLTSLFLPVGLDLIHRVYVC